MSSGISFLQLVIPPIRNLADKNKNHGSPFFPKAPILISTITIQSLA